MCLKLLFYYLKRNLQAILSLTVFSYCFFVSLNFDTAFLPYCTKFCSVFFGYWIGNLIRIPKMYLKLLFSYFKRILRAILSLTVFLSVKTLTPLFSLTVPNFIVFFSVNGK